MLKIPLYMVSPEAVSQCCSTATAIVYENARTHDTATIYKDQEHLVAEEYSSSDNTDNIIDTPHAATTTTTGTSTTATVSTTVSTTVTKKCDDVIDTLKKTISIKGSSYSSEKRGQHYIYVLTNTVPKLKEPRSLYCVPRDIVPPRWPVGIEGVCPDPNLSHKHTSPPFVEEFYKRPSGSNLRLLEKVDTDKDEGTVVYQLPPMRFPFYTRSRPAATLETIPLPLPNYPNDDVIRFESRFESANLFRARRVGPYEYELELRWDYFTMKHTQWFYFMTTNTRAGPTYKFTIINLLKSGSLYNEGMKPLFYSEQNAKNKNIGWVRTGHNIHYYKNNIRRKDCKGERYQYSLTWQFQYPHNGDVCYFAHCYPYTYTDLQTDLLEIAKDPVKSQYVKQRILCHSLGGNMVHLLTVTTPSSHLTEAKQKRAVVVTSRVHPGETNSSYMMRGFINFITGPSPDAKVLRDNFVFKIVPMLNPDGVIVGNYRSSLAARDLNRNYKNPIKDAYPTIWSVKAMIRRMLTEREVVLYCDLHGHSRKMNVFMYGCENKEAAFRLHERVFPNMMGRNTSKFKYSSCRFKVQKKKEGTGRIVMWQQMGILNSFTMEATFAGYNNVHFNSKDLEDMGYHFCDTLLDYCDPDTTKVDHVLSNLTRIVKAQYAAKLGKNIDDIKDLPLEDMDFSDLESSDGGSDSSVSDGPPKLPMLRKKCASLQSKKKYKTRKERNMIHRQSRRRKPGAPETVKTQLTGSVVSESSKKEKQSKIKAERRYSVSSGDSPPAVPKQSQGVPKHAQERIEERQAKVKDSGPGDFGAVTAGIFHPNSSRDSPSPVCQKSSNSASDSRPSLEPAKIAFSSKENDVVYAVLEPTGELDATVSKILDCDGDHVIKEEDSNYSVSYRNSDVNSRSLGKNTFAIRPSKSAYRAANNSNKPSHVITSSKSDLYPEYSSTIDTTTRDTTTTSTLGNKNEDFIPNRTTLGISSPLFGKDPKTWQCVKTDKNTAISPLDSSHHENGPGGSTGGGMMKVLSMNPPERVVSHQPDVKSMIHANNFTSAYVDKLLHSKRHSVPKAVTTRDVTPNGNEYLARREPRRGVTPHEIIRTPGQDSALRGTMTTRDRGHTTRSVPTRDLDHHVATREQLSREHVSAQSRIEQSSREHLSRGVRPKEDIGGRRSGTSNQSPTKQGRGLVSMRKNDSRSSNISPNSEGKKRLKQTSLSWDTVKLAGGSNPGKVTSLCHLGSRYRQRISGRLGFRPQKL